MYSPTPYTSVEKSGSPCADLLAMAERELSAFFQAVTRLFGVRHAALSAEEWLNELTTTSHLPASAREWRRFTAKVSTRLASRVTATEFLNV
jgi:hypothetical protein